MISGRIREAAVAGSFYPDDPQELREVLHHLLTHAPVPDDDALSFKAMVVPHAGYVFSGPIAASAYVCLKHRREHVSSVTLIGPAHYVGFKGIASVDYDWFRTPLGAFL
jgi:AmmeMemoRadiSam system protein B